MPNDRIDAVLVVIEAVAGADERRQIENDLRTKNQGQIDSSLSIGGFRGPFKSEPETFRRSLARAVALVKLARGTLQTTGASTHLQSLMGKNTGQLERELKSLFPFKAFRGSFEGRRDWSPTHFTDPTAHSTTKYTYLIHCLMQAPSKVAEYNIGNQSELENFNKLREQYLPYAQVSKKNKYKPNLFVDFMGQYLDNLDILKANIISCSVISEAKHASYYPFGFILRVPPECVYITSPRDVAVKNRTNDIIGELQTKGQGVNNTILSPDQVLAGTTGINGSEHYNEVVVVGTAPEGKQVDVIGIFVKTDANGNLYVRPADNTTTTADTASYATSKSCDMLAACARKFNLPIVPIPDSASVVLGTPTPWPFDGTQKLVGAKTQTGFRAVGTGGRARSGTM